MSYTFSNFLNSNEDDFQQDNPLTVSRLTRAIKTNLERAFPTVWVEGELSNVRLPRSGHYYFVLKDQRAQIKAVMFHNRNRLLKFRPEDGQKVIVSGQVTVYEARGDYQIIVSFMEPKGTGALQLAFEQLKLKLKNEGLFAQDNKKPLPLFPAKIGVVTSSTGAAIHDILNVLRRRFENVSILIFPSKVQGKEAAAEIVEGIRLLNDITDVDVLIVGRGGGSIEDLWPFNEEIVARAIYSSKKPIISAVGHETDFTIADFVADVRAPTPSAAAELVVKDRDDLRNRLKSYAIRISRQLQQSIQVNDNRLKSIMSRTIYKEPEHFFQEWQFKLDDKQSYLNNFGTSIIEKRQNYLALLNSRLSASNPNHFIETLVNTNSSLLLRIKRAFYAIIDRKNNQNKTQHDRIKALSPIAHLNRGYALILDETQKKIIKNTEKLTKDSHLWIQFVDGQTFCDIKKINHRIPWREKNGEKKEEL